MLSVCRLVGLFDLKSVYWLSFIGVAGGMGGNGWTCKIVDRADHSKGKKEDGRLKGLLADMEQEQEQAYDH